MDDPSGSTGWLHAVGATISSVWQAFLVPTALGGFAVYRYITGRHDTAQERADKRQAADDAEVKRLTERADGQTARYVAQLQDDNKELRVAIVAREAEINRQISLARAWFNAAHRTWHDWANVVTIANRLLERAEQEGVPDAKWPAALSQDIDKPG